MVNKLTTLLNSLAMWNAVALVKVECFSKHVISKPHLHGHQAVYDTSSAVLEGDLGKSIEKSLVIIVCYPATILDLP